MNKKCSFTQIYIASPDITAVKITTRDRRIFLASVYVPPVGTESNEGETGTVADRRQLAERLQVLQQAIEHEKANYPDLELFIAGDFNRHDLLWGGNKVGLSPRQGEAQGILEFIESNDLQSLLPRGTVTWEIEGRASSIIDLTLASPRLVEDRIKCMPFKNEYRSDHRAIHSSFQITTGQEVQAARMLYKHAK